MWFTGARLETTTDIPSDILIDAMVDTDACRFCQWSFGNTLCKRVAVLIEMDGDRPYRVFLDLDRDRSIESDEEITSRIHDNNVWISELPVHVECDKDIIAAARQVAIYPKKDRVRIRTLGHAACEVDLAGEKHIVRRIDIDGDGIPVGPQDQIWVDLDRDGKFDPISERFNMSDQLTIGSKQYTVRSDRLGHNITLTPQDAVGKLQFKFELSDKKATIEKLEGALRDENGMLIAVRLSEDPISVPAGKYCLEHLVVHVVDADETTWRMTLARGMETDSIDVSSVTTQTVQLLEDFQFYGEPVQELEKYSGFESHVQATVYLSLIHI